MTKLEEVYGYHKNPNTGGWEVLIAWKRLPPHDSTWEIIEDFNRQFPMLHLEDKVDLESGSNVRPPVIHQHHRRDKGKNERNN